jgi:peptide-methionine (S)-S-oxide reductase
MKCFCIVFIIFASAVVSCNEKMGTNKDQLFMNNQNELQAATFGSGCFWCTEAVFERLKGVESVLSGYSGGSVKNPTYEEVCRGNTGHAEVIQITFNPEIISYDELLEIFWKTHDPTTLNRQGADIGSQYRSVIFYHNEEQKKKALAYKAEISSAGIWKDPVVTEIVPFEEFFEAEKYHQDYYANNPDAGYCAFVITPKLEKFEKIFKKKLKK